MIKVGDTIRGYKVLDLINEGGFCNAFKVSKGGSTYFLKEYSDPTELSADWKPFIENQKKIIGTLNTISEGVEYVNEHFIEEGHYYQVKQFLKGENLTSWSQHDEDMTHRFDVAKQLACVLKKIHAKKIVHQDLKPDQIMVVSQAPLKIVVTDFDWAVPGGKVVRRVGSPWFAYVDDNPSEKSDIFTLGIMLTELLTGVNPYIDNGDHDADVWIRWVKNKKYLEPISLNPDDITRKLNKVLTACLSPVPSERPTIDEIISVLDNPKDIKRSLTLSSGKSKLILTPGRAVDIKDFKLFFPDTTDADGNPIYMYINHGVTALRAARAGDGLSLCVPDKLSNKFLLNGKELTAAPVPVKDGDRLELYSTKRHETVATFNIKLS